MSKDWFVEIKEKIIKFKEGLEPQQIQLIFYSVGALLVILILVFIYRPLAVKLGAAEKELSSVQVNLASQRNKAAAFTKLDLQGRLMQQGEISQAIDELTEKGRALDVKFISITPKKLEKGSEGSFKLLPIAFQIEANYQRLGQFLEYLESFPRTVAEVKSFVILPREDMLPNLNVELLVHLYLEGKDAR